MNRVGEFIINGLLVVMLVVFLASPQLFAPLFQPLVQPNAPPIYVQASLLSLTFSHLEIVAVATALATLIAVTHLPSSLLGHLVQHFCRSRAASSMLDRHFRLSPSWRLPYR